MEIENKLDLLSTGAEDIRDYYIKGKVQDHFDEVKALGYTIVACFLRGSQNYNLDIYTKEYISDIDTTCFVLPTFDDFVKNNQLVSTTHVRANGEHIEIKDIRLLGDLLKKTNPAFVELLFTKYKIINPQYEDYINILIQNRETIAKLDKNRMIKSISGIVAQKYHNLCHDAPHSHDIIQKYGYDPKELHHMVRLYYVVEKYLQNKPWEECTIPSKDERFFLINIKLGKEFTKEQALQKAAAINDEVKNFATSHLFEDANKDLDCINLIDTVISDILKHSLQDEIINKLHIVFKVSATFIFSELGLEASRVFKKLGISNMFTFLAVSSSSYNDTAFTTEPASSPYGSDCAVLDRYISIDDPGHVIKILNNDNLAD